MAIGTAGYTAMLCVLALERHGMTPEHGEILLTGAAGGVDSVATAFLTKLGYSVVAVSGRPEETEYIKSLGAVEILDRAEFAAPGKPLGKKRWAGAVDVVGSHTLANVCAIISREVGLTEVIPVASQMLNGELRGRIVVDVNR